MQTQIDYRQISRTGLRLLSIRFDILAHAPPCVDLVRQIDRHHEIIEGQAIKGRASWRTIAGIFLAAGRGTRTQRWIVIGANVAQRRPRLLVLGNCRFQVLVGNIDLLL